VTLWCARPEACRERSLRRLVLEQGDRETILLSSGADRLLGDNKLDNKLDQDTENLEKEGDEAPAVLAAKKKRASE
jgi:hypothetical protein